ncbi:hypothetical protein NVV76_10085 [Pediococcus ethanolidurans]|nr:hypothetical protein [Pediococcus ethanolidurans]MCV3328499.1 hypothetical protein [Pediococcus ethanolidurans]MCV3555320.1 hypothetical protein [Pediococcus ethanolidurans]
MMKNIFTVRNIVIIVYLLLIWAGLLDGNGVLSILLKVILTLFIIFELVQTFHKSVNTK